LPSPSVSKPADNVTSEQTQLVVPTLPEDLPPRRRGRPPKTVDSQG
jgi:hypothetical protein